MGCAGSGAPPAPVAPRPTDANPVAQSVAQSVALDPGPDPEPEPESPSVDHRDGELGPLSAEVVAALWEGPEDPPAKFDTPYIISNESRHDLFQPYIPQLGGAYLGVGADQNYTLMATARAEFAYLMDLDFRVVDVHRTYAVLIPLAPTAEALLEMFEEQNLASSLGELDKGLHDQPEEIRKRILKRFKLTRKTLRGNMLKVRGRKVDRRKMSTWLSDPEAYAHVHAMFSQHRVRPIVGDLTGTQSMSSIAESAQRIGVPITVVYLSNAEEYFDYTPSFTKNLRGLPTSDDARVLRTLRIYGWVVADRWHYQIQSLPDFQERLSDAAHSNRRKMLTGTKSDGLQRVTRQPGQSLIALPELDAGDAKRPTSPAESR
jgi:hypothetical protein